MASRGAFGRTNIFRRIKLIRYLIVLVPCLFIILNLYIFVFSSNSSYNNSETPKTSDPRVDNIELTDEDTIFVSIAAYRDFECKVTIRDLYDQASRPDLIYVGAVQQNDPNDPIEECNAWTPKERLSQVKIHAMHYKESKGPCPARNIAAALFTGQKWFMQIDSHTTFSKHWDKIAVNQIKYLPKKNCFISPSYQSS